MSETNVSFLAIPEMERHAVINYAASQREIPTYLMTPKLRGPFMRIKPDKTDNPFEPVHHESTFTEALGPLYEPAYEGRRFLINAKASEVYTRTGGHLQKFNLREVHETLLQRLHVACFSPNEDVWVEAILPCIRVAVKDTLCDLGRTFIDSLIILDRVHDKITFTQRRAWLQERLPVLGIKQRPAPGAVYLVPTFRPRIATQLCAALALQNKEWHGRVYSGIIAKSLGAFYVHQLTSPYTSFYSREFFNINNLDGFHES